MLSWNKGRNTLKSEQVPNKVVLGEHRLWEEAEEVTQLLHMLFEWKSLPEGPLSGWTFGNLRLWQHLLGTLLSCPMSCSHLSDHSRGAEELGSRVSYLIFASHGLQSLIKTPHTELHITQPYNCVTG